MLTLEPMSLVQDNTPRERVTYGAVKIRPSSDTLWSRDLVRYFRVAKVYLNLTACV